MSHRPRPGTLAAALLIPAALAAQPGATPAQRPAPPSPTLLHYDVRDLPLVEVPAAPSVAGGARSAPDSTLVLLVTGDGDWADIDRGIAGALTRAGAAVVALRARAYLQGGPRSPDGMARDVERTLRHYLPLWGRDRVVLVGYSRGAELLPFVATRLPADLRARVDLLAMLGLSTTASFQFHWSDIVTDRARRSDLPVAPELARLRGTRMLCVYGSDEKDSGCRGADPSLVQRVERPGGHHFDGDFPALGGLVLQALARR